ncbi:hypothetical protein BKP37_17230 [Anaerobacillus alkalilacustris]|uniref:DUF1450 domain-containing protein n=1 Tax=Anaerobacillus alkalilacustris TaxID=393763 RepID=A0A1S2LEQ7_9BACI|nr:DUF1450 domain-containing protein [Anaerobacillus alkalilacustris]OIJ10804.1 hypothetical protein BKP37_17230 [Anaerobacillus alkalilacustris]
MEKVYFCQENKFNTKKVYKKLKKLDLVVKIKRKNCIGECKTCKQGPFSVMNGKVITCDTAKELYKKIYKKVN